MNNINNHLFMYISLIIIALIFTIYISKTKKTNKIIGTFNPLLPKKYTATECSVLLMGDLKKNGIQSVFNELINMKVIEIVKDKNKKLILKKINNDVKLNSYQKIFMNYMFVTDTKVELIKFREIRVKNVIEMVKISIETKLNKEADNKDNRKIKAIIIFAMSILVAIMIFNFLNNSTYGKAVEEPKEYILIIIGYITNFALGYWLVSVFKEPRIKISLKLSLLTMLLMNVLLFDKINSYDYQVNTEIVKYNAFEFIWLFYMGAIFSVTKTRTKKRLIILGELKMLKKSILEQNVSDVQKIIDNNDEFTIINMVNALGILNEFEKIKNKCRNGNIGVNSKEFDEIKDVKKINDYLDKFYFV